MESAPSPETRTPPSRALWRRWLGEYGPPVLLGALAFFVVLGGGILRPTNIAWMDHFDPAQYYLSWSFYRQTPWTLPLGANPDYGLDLGTTIFFSDVIPLAALIAKVFSPWLPVPFQYWGIWLLLCFILQAVFGWKLAGLATPHRWGRLLGATLFVFSPPFLFRLNFHYSLVSQWLLLAALYLCLAPKTTRRDLGWPALGFLGAGIHPYLWTMVLALWTSDLARRLILREKSIPALLGEVASVVVASTAMLWLGGFFMIGRGLQSWGLGDAHMNLWALLNPSNFPEKGKWSYLLPSLPPYGFDFEGANYLGLGLIFLYLICLIAGHPFRALVGIRREWLPLLIVLVLLTIFAISNRVSLGPLTLATYPLPHILDMFRSSGRMFWPVFYTLIYLALRFLFLRLGTRSALMLLVIATAAQVLDTSAGWLVVRQNRNAHVGPAWNSPLHSDFWTQAASRYQRVYLIPFIDFPDTEYQIFAYYAQAHHLGTDAAYLSRYDPFQLEKHQARLDEELTSGHYDPGALYILDAPHIEMARKSVNPQVDFLEQVDGFTVLAPGWKTPRK